MVIAANESCWVLTAAVPESKVGSDTSRAIGVQSPQSELQKIRKAMTA